MKTNRLAGLVVVLAALAAPASAQGPAKAPEIALRDGGRVVVRPDGAMEHYDAAGRKVAMGDGVEMVARDGARILMKNAALWRQAIEAAATSYGLASSLPASPATAGERTVELADGGRVVLRGDGTFVRSRADGSGVRTKDGDVLVAKDGTRLLVSKGTVWTPAATGTQGAGK
jgi:hypothetical protein